MQTVEDVLEHFGVRGMKWGVRRKNSRLDDEPIQFLSEDAGNAVKAAKKAKIHGTKSLTNKELQDLITRMNLEKQYAGLTPQQRSQKAKFIRGGVKFATDILLTVGKQELTKLAAKQLAKALVG